MSPKPTSRWRRLIFPVLAILMVLPALPREAEAYYYRYYSGHHYRYRGFGHFSRYRGHYYSPYGYGSYGYGRYPYGRYGRESSVGGLDLALAKKARLGAVQLQVKPRRAQVYLDGQLIGNAGDFDGYPNYLWLEEGTHQLIFYRDGRVTSTAEVTIQPGVIGQTKVRMERGEAVDPESLTDAPGNPELS